MYVCKQLFLYCPVVEFSIFYAAFTVCMYCMYVYMYVCMYG
jgi:hypothetical protein